MHSTHNEGKFVAADRFIRTLKNKIYKYMISVQIWLQRICILINYIP